MSLYYVEGRVLPHKRDVKLNERGSLLTQKGEEDRRSHTYVRVHRQTQTPQCNAMQCNVRWGKLVVLAGLSKNEHLVTQPYVFYTHIIQYAVGSEVNELALTRGNIP